MSDNGDTSQRTAAGSISFERIADTYDATRGGLPRGRVLAADIFGWVDAEPIVELGVGTGAVAMSLRDRLGRSVLGLDLSPAMAAIAHDRLGEVVAVGDVGILPMQDESAGTIVCVWVLHLVDDLQVVFHECARVLRPDGVMAVIVGGGTFSEDDMEPIITACLDRFVRPGARKDAVIEAAETAGLIVDAEGQATELEWEQSPNAEADRLERRNYGTLLDLDDETFEAAVRPAIEGLRNLPDPDRPRRRAVRHDFVILQKPWPL